VIGEEVAIEVEMREEKGSGSSTRSSLLSVGGSSTEGYNFLEALDEEPEDEKEKERRESRKRKRIEEIRIEVRQSGLKSTQGWEQRSEKERGDEKWKVERIREDLGTGEIVREEGHVLVPEGFDMGLDRRGVTLNNANRKNNLMGNGRGALFPREKGERGKGKNWIATFTRAG
jgi:hypothetical protein